MDESEIRKLAGKTLTEAAAQISVSRSTLWNWERGRTRLTSEQVTALRRFYVGAISVWFARLSAFLQSEGVQV